MSFVKDNNKSESFTMPILDLETNLVEKKLFGLNTDRAIIMSKYHFGILKT